MEKNTVSAKGQLSESDIIRFQNPEGKGSRIMFAGNSITLHGIRPEIGWNQCWGMAASRKEKDYVHCIMRTVKQRDEDAAFCICQVAEWEKDYCHGESVLNRFEQAREFGADIIIVRFVENCPKAGFQPRVFKDELRKLLQYLNGTGQAKFILTTGFWRHPGDETIRQFSGERGWPLIELGDLGEDDKMKAIGMYAHCGISNHPGDLGMKSIAERISKELIALL